MAYLVFIGATCAADLKAARKLAGKAAGAVPEVMPPSNVVTIFAQQNGLLIAALVGQFVMPFVRRGYGRAFRWGR